MRKRKLSAPDLIALSRGDRYPPLMAECGASNGPLRGRRQQEPPGSRKLSQQRPNTQTHTLRFNKSPPHRRQASSWRRRGVSAGSAFRSSAAETRVSVQHPAVSSYTLCKYIVYCSRDNIKAWKPVGTRGCGKLPGEKEAAKRTNSVKGLPKEGGKWLAYFVGVSPRFRVGRRKGNQSTSFRERGFFEASNSRVAVPAYVSHGGMNEATKENVKQKIYKPKGNW